MTDAVSRISWREAPIRGPASLHRLHVTSKPCRVHRPLLRRRRGRHFHSLLAQFGLMPKSRRGLAAGEAVDAHQAARCVLHYGTCGRAPPAPSGPALRTTLAGLFPPPATLLDGTAEHTKAHVDGPVARCAIAAVRRTGVLGGDVVSATSVDSL